jgi:DNA anti-recombination protein RmuC
MANGDYRDPKPEEVVQEFGDKLSKTGEHVRHASDELEEASKDMEGAAERARTIEAGFRLRGENLRSMSQRVRNIETEVSVIKKNGNGKKKE